MGNLEVSVIKEVGIFKVWEKWEFLYDEGSNISSEGFNSSVIKEVGIFKVCEIREFLYVEGVVTIMDEDLFSL